MKHLFQSLLKRAARRYVRRHDPYIIGITGSVGKTTCRMIVSEVLQQTLPGLRITTSPKNFNSEIGLVLALFEVKTFTPHFLRVGWTLLYVLCKTLFGRKSYDVIVLEYGIDHPGDMDYLLSIVKPHISIFTGLDKVHAAYFETIDQILEEKMKLIQQSKEIVFLPVQAGYVEEYTHPLSIDVLTYALTDTESADVGFADHRLGMEDEIVYAEFTLHQEDETLMRIRTNVLGQEQAGYISLGLELAMILERRLTSEQTPLTTLSGEKNLGIYEILFQQQPGRFDVFAGKWGSILIDSSYNAAPKSMEKTLENVMRLRREVFPDRDLIYCLGDMRELGDFAETEHRQLASIVAQSADAVYLVGEWMTSVMQDELEKIGYNPSDIFCFKESRELGQQLLNDIELRKRLSLILFKGSQNTIFLEEAVALLLKNEEDKGKLCRQEKWWEKKKGKNS